LFRATFLCLTLCTAQYLGIAKDRPCNATPGYLLPGTGGPIPVFPPRLGKGD